MANPPVVRVLGKDYQIEWGATDLGEGVMGDHSQSELKIRVRGGMPHDEERETLLHELIHAVDEQLGIRMTEKRVRMLSVGVYALLRDNPKLRAYLSKGQK